jgi:hypothetical protein
MLSFLKRFFIAGQLQLADLIINGWRLLGGTGDKSIQYVERPKDSPALLSFHGWEVLTGLFHQLQVVSDAYSQTNYQTC